MGPSVEEWAMKPSSIRLWSIAFLGASLVPVCAAEAWWPERYYDDGYAIESYPRGYQPRGGAVLVYPAPRYRNPQLLYRRGRAVYLEPYYEDEGPIYEEVVPYDGYPDEPPRLRPRDADRAVVGTPLVGGSAPRVVPGIAPRRAGEPKVVSVKPAEMPKAAPKSQAEAPPPITASIALPVPRPNLEGMDFAPAKPSAAVIPPDPTANEGRR
jgi:hypothetical protein